MTAPLSRWSITRSALVAMSLLTAACAQTGQPAVHAPKPPADFVFIGSGDTSRDKKIVVKMNFDLKESNDPDGKLMLPFGMLFGGAIRGAEPTSNSATGTGLTHNDPIVFDAVAEEAELDAVANYLATKFPDPRNVKGRLYRSPERRYLVWVNFDTRANSNALYFDVTKWAAALRQAYAQ
jgi:hypothetical protein